ncbi:hypothetical protein OQJ18_13570 [Fluoribacter dumoffii]|uniref:hypothetical protein n=1 Tax=Fluoribacter dumoffii TaxID=463 RepID=UPI002243291F|nr:hypothetical protein [Fluoribacter dumoffii]MCW8387580.1 hypothetical protein [Fluoribacter dumoffii]MCW8416875.1 hypothetical protein [Fluoribacter dumoffii]MCW8455285.1 hypothetical protein [Fluoribacter dumoffii]MCW8460637.1 hypothetical protein [Fluoribacter dumoffii]MCW8484118.1 hypothetical protein [Fluoribacter dumoffii]
MLSVQFFKHEEMAASFKIKPPKLFWEYGIVLDWQSNHPIASELIKELEGKFIPEIRDLVWPKKGAPLIESVVRLVKKEFKNNHPTVSLQLNPQASSMSHPLLMSVSDFVALPPQKPAYSLEAFVYRIMVLLMMRYTVDHCQELEQTSPLIEKYKSEGAAVTNRLFPFALVQYAYEKNGRLEELKERIQEAVTPAVKRAWEIISTEGSKFIKEIEDHEAFIENYLTTAEFK